MSKGNPKPSASFKKNDPRINRNGAPKKEFTWAGTIRRVMEEMEELEGKDIKVAVAKSLLKECIKGNMTAIKEFGDRMDGKAVQKVETKSIDDICQDLEDANNDL